MYGVLCIVYELCIFRGGRRAVWNGDFKSETDTDTHEFRGTHDCSHAIAYCCCLHDCATIATTSVPYYPPKPPIEMCGTCGVLCGHSRIKMEECSKDMYIGSMFGSHGARRFAGERTWQTVCAFVTVLENRRVLVHRNDLVLWHVCEDLCSVVGAKNVCVCVCCWMFTCRIVAVFVVQVAPISFHRMP